MFRIARRHGATLTLDRRSTLDASLSKHDKQEKAYHFLRKKVGKEFQLQELCSASGWQEGSATTYISKHLKGLIEPLGRGRKKYRVRHEFRRLDWRSFKNLADQTRHVFQAYDRKEYSAVMTFEFLLPLTQESKLRRALDDLFYSDTIEMLLVEAGGGRFTKWLPPRKRENDEAYIRRLAAHASDLFGGYSVSHVSGRFRAAAPCTRQHAGAMYAEDQVYLIDETTAVVRFIVPIQASLHETTKPIPGAQLTFAMDLDEEDERSIADEVDFVRELFFCLFVEALIRNVTGEDQIWLIEESPEGRRLHVWEPEG